MRPRILAISTHPDDETLGCGGTLLKHGAAGDELFWLVATSTWTPQWSAELVQRKSAEIDSVAERYDMAKVFRLGFPATRMDTVEEGALIQSIRQVIREVRPETVYLVHCGDVHSDHRMVFDATMAVLKPFYMHELGVKRVLSYETLSSTDAAPVHVRPPFEPQVFNEISPFLKEKVAIMNLFASEVHADPSPRGPSAIEALARYRGATIGKLYAEAFVLIREVL